jgi:hypothetical protein
VNVWADLVEEYGEERPLPADPSGGLRRMKEKACFRNAAITARDRGLAYCEGWAWMAGIDDPFIHSWNLAEDGAVIDRTWRPFGVR